MDYNAAIKYNPSEITSAPRPKERNKFFSDLEKKNLLKWKKVCSRRKNTTKTKSKKHIKKRIIA